MMSRIEVIERSTPSRDAFAILPSPPPPVFVPVGWIYFSDGIAAYFTTDAYVAAYWERMGNPLTPVFKKVEPGEATHIGVLAADVVADVAGKMETRISVVRDAEK